MNLVTTEYGPGVVCDFTGFEEQTHRPSGSTGPWFCMACGSTTHPARSTA